MASHLDISTGLEAGCAQDGFDVLVSPALPAQNSSQKPSRTGLKTCTWRWLRTSHGAMRQADAERGQGQACDRPASR